MIGVGTLQQMLLKERHDYFVSPEDQFFVLLGQGLHALMHHHAAGAEQAEHRMTVVIDKVKVGGTPDNLELLLKVPALPSGKKHALEMVDYKVTSLYKVKKMLEVGMAEAGEWPAQLNYYWMLACISPDSPIIKAGIDPASVEPRLVLDCISRDHRGFEADRAEREGKVYPKWDQPFELEARPVADIMADARAAVKKWKAAKDLPDNKLPKCDAKLLWGGKRCESYCEARPFCSQATAVLQRKANKAGGF
jgi:hypothetical protein